MGSIVTITTAACTLFSLFNASPCGTVWLGGRANVDVGRYSVAPDVFGIRAKNGARVEASHFTFYESTIRMTCAGFGGSFHATSLKAKTGWVVSVGCDTLPDVSDMDGGCDDDAPPIVTTDINKDGWRVVAECPGKPQETPQS